MVAVVVPYLGGGWYFSSLIRSRALDGAERRTSMELEPTLVVRGIAGGTIELAVAEGADEPSLGLDGLFGLRWRGGYGQVGAVERRRGDVVARSFRLVRGNPPVVGDLAELDPRAFPDPASAGVDVIEVAFPGPLGSYPAWFVPTDGPTWVVLVHGNSMSRLDNVRLLPSLRDLGYPTLSITHRNDAGAPRDPSGLLRYGLTEWEDLEAAIRYALDRGSEGVILIGDSMGAAVIAAFLQRSELAGAVRGLVMDAPMLDLSRTVDDNASREEVPLLGTPLPPGMTALAKWLARLRFGVEWDDLDYLRDPSIYRVPILVFHGTGDLTVPITTTDRFAALVPGARVVRCEGADHIGCWNVDPESYEAELTKFLRSVAP
jgi:pimeloyl-ACP methyl ester carboxylesterase